MAAPPTEPPPSAEERARANLEERRRFFEKVWRSGPVGKTFVVLVLLTFVFGTSLQLVAVV